MPTESPEMLAGQDIIYFAQGKWDGLWRSRQQLMSIFARKNRVLYVEGRPTLRFALHAFVGKDLRRSDLHLSSVRQVSENLFVCRFPIWAPESDRFPLKRLTRTVGWLFIQHALRKLHMSRPIVWLSQPSMVDLIEAIPSACLRVYHVYDEYGGYCGLTPASRHQIEELEKRMMELVDIVIVSSKRLYDAKSSLHANTYFVPHGVNYKAYTAALRDPYIPDGLRSIKAPRLGYVGLISDKLDLQMIGELAQNHANWSLVFVGEARVSTQRDIWQALISMSNVHYLGEVEVSQVPYYIKGFDVGLVPYVLNRYAENAQPLKVYDYLAAGLPIASVDVPAVREFGQYIHVTERPRDFSQAVEAALADTTPERCQARRNIAAQHTWEVRVEQLSDVLQTHLATKFQNERKSVSRYD